MTSKFTILSFELLLVATVIFEFAKCQNDEEISSYDLSQATLQRRIGHQSQVVSWELDSIRFTNGNGRFQITSRMELKCYTIARSKLMKTLEQRKRTITQNIFETIINENRLFIKSMEKNPIYDLSEATLRKFDNGIEWDLNNVRLVHYDSQRMQKLRCFRPQRSNDLERLISLYISSKAY